MNQYIYRIQLNRPALLVDGPNKEEAAALQDHVAYLEALATKGIVLLAGRTQTDDPDGYGIVILQASTNERANEIMNNDPAVKHNVMRAKIHPYKIAVLSESIV